MERELALEFVRVTEAAALAAGRLMGRGDKEAADQAAVDAMRSVFDTVHINGTVVIGEGRWMKPPCFISVKKWGRAANLKLMWLLILWRGQTLLPKVFPMLSP